MPEAFSEKAKKILFIAQEESGLLGKRFVGPEHLLLAVVREADDDLKHILKRFNIEYNILRLEIEALTADINIKVAIFRDLTPDAKVVLRNAVEECFLDGHTRVEISHILIAILKNEDSIIPKLFSEIKCDRFELMNAISGLNRRKMNEFSKKEEKTKSNILERFGTDLTEEAKNNRLDPVIGRHLEINRMIRVLLRRTKNNPVLIGEPGVGKSAIVEGLAILISSGEAPQPLKNSKLFQLSLPSLIAGAKFRGDFEERIKSLIDELSNSKNTIMFIDELHTIVGAGAPEGSMDAANILKPALARGEIQIIGATTIDEYRKRIEKDPALERRFQPIYIEEPNVEQTIEILKGLKNKFEEYHQIKISDEAIEQAAKLSERYINDRFLPDKAIDLLDESSAQLKLDMNRIPNRISKLERKLEEEHEKEKQATAYMDYENAALIHCNCMEIERELEKARILTSPPASFRTLHSSTILSVISEWTGIPLENLKSDEIITYLELEKILGRSIIGQDNALNKISSSIRRSRVNLSNPDKPLGSFIFLGPSGVGKTETAKVLAKNIFGSEDSLIRIDMSELMEKHAVSRLIGSPPGYIGFENGGQLTERVRRRPYSLILFDEVEKAHPDIFNILLQILDEGQLTSSQGIKVNFKNTIIIMTSNAGSEKFNSSSKIGYFNDEDIDYDMVSKNLKSHLKKIMRPELINRVDEIIVFNELTKRDLREITEVKLEEVKKRLSENNIIFDINQELIDHIVETAFHKKSGARPISRLIDKIICDLFAENILAGKLSPGDEIMLNFDRITEKVGYTKIK